MSASSSAPVMTPDQAYGLFLDNIYRPAFLTKLASDHPQYQPKTAQDEEALLKLAGQLRTLREAQQEQVAHQHTSVLQKAAAHLDQVLGQGHSRDSEIEKIAGTLAKDPVYRTAAVTYLNAAASAILAGQPAGEAGGGLNTEGN